MGDQKLLLHFDDSGARDPNRTAPYRSDGIDCFALGGILTKSEELKSVVESHQRFLDEWGITYPLHSSPMRGGRGNFGWLQKHENRQAFLPALEEHLLSLPVVCIACVIHRPGYVGRYREVHQERLWHLCKTAFSILVERSAKFADSHGRRLEVFFEQTGKREDRNIKAYQRELKTAGSPFSVATSGAYAPLTADDYRRIVLGEPRGLTKKSPLIQIADLVLYPMVKGGYDESYSPLSALRRAGRLIDCHLTGGEQMTCGIKYSCFDKK